jgi:cell division protein FtsZ
MVHLVENEPGARIKVIGTGGCGGNAINHMIATGLHNVDFVSVNTDAQALLNNSAPTRLQIGRILTAGRGTGGNPEIGRKAVLEDEERLRELLAEAEMVFVTAGMGGGTGTGSAPAIARFARDNGALTVGVVTKPFLFEGRKRRSQADEGVRELKDAVDTLIIIPNDRLLSVANRSTTLKAAFEKADEVLLQAVRGISELVTEHGLINLDFADVRSVMAEMGIAMMGTAHASGEDRAAEAAQRAISSPLLEDTSINGARGLLINFTGGPDMSLYEVNEAASLIQEQAHEDANIIFGAVIDEELAGEIHVTVIATGFGEHQRGTKLTRSVPLEAVPDAVAKHVLSRPPKPQPVSEVPTLDLFPPENSVPERSIPEASTPPSIAEPSIPEPSIPEPSLPLRPEVQTAADIPTASNAAPVEPESLQHVSTPEAPPLPPSHSIIVNGKSKSIRRLEVIKEGVFDLAAFVRRNGAQSIEAIRSGRNSPASRAARLRRVCTSCGAAELADAAAFCTKCGASLR